MSINIFSLHGYRILKKNKSVNKMKPRPLYICLLLTQLLCECLSAQSPLDKGNYIISGSVSYKSIKKAISAWEAMEDEESGSGLLDKGDLIKSAQLELSPGIYYFIINNFAIGGSFIYRDYKSDLHMHYTIKGYSPGLRYYYMLGDIIPFGSVNYLVESLIGYDSDFDDESETNGIMISIGFDHFLTKNVALQVFVNYQTLNWRSKWSDDTRVKKSLAVGVGIEMFVF